MRATLLGAGVLACGVAAAVLAVLALDDDGSGVPERLAGRPAVAEAELEPRSHLFGDEVVARVEAVVDRSALDPSALRLEADFEPYEPVGPVTVERRDLGGLTRLRLSVPLRCLGGECVPPTARRVFAFRPGALVAAGEQVASFEWPEVEVTSRISQSGLVDSQAIIQMHWRANMTDLPPPTYRVAPGVAVAGLAGLAGVLAAGALALLVAALRPTPREPPRLPPLERALVLLETAHRGGDAEEQRRALDLVAAELGRTGEGDLARTASALAWSRPQPASDETERLKEHIAVLVAEGRNGRGA